MSTKRNLVKVLIAIFILAPGAYLMHRYRTVPDGIVIRGVLLDMEERHTRRRINYELTYGFFLDSVGYIGTRRISEDISDEFIIGECVDVRYDPADPTHSTASSATYSCENEKPFILYGYYGSLLKTETMHIDVHYADTTISHVYVTDYYHLPLDSVNCDIVFRKNKKRSKVLRLELDSSATDWIMHLDPNFEDGMGSDTIYLYYDPVVDELVKREMSPL